MLARLAALTALMLMAGCQTPLQLKSSPTMEHGSIPLAFAAPTDKTALCLQRAYENASSYFTTRLSPSGPQSYELIARHDQTYVFAIFDIRPGTLEYWVEPAIVSTPEERLRRVLATCR
jgi:hypothetical protein